MAREAWPECLDGFIVLCLVMELSRLPLAVSRKSRRNLMRPNLSLPFATASRYTAPNEPLIRFESVFCRTGGTVLSAQHGLSYRYIELRDFVMLKKSLLVVIVPCSSIAPGEECGEGLSTAVERCL